MSQGSDLHSSRIADQSERWSYLGTGSRIRDVFNIEDRDRLRDWVVAVGGRPLDLNCPGDLNFRFGSRDLPSCANEAIRWGLVGLAFEGLGGALPRAWAFRGQRGVIRRYGLSRPYQPKMARLSLEATGSSGYAGPLIGSPHPSK